MRSGRTALPPARRGAALVLTAALHLGALLLFLRPAGPLPTVPARDALSVFDLPVPPPTEEPEVPAPDPVQPRIEGESPGAGREPAARRPTAPIPVIAAPDTIPLPAAPPVLLPALDGGGPEQTAEAGTRGTGAGTGDGEGLGPASLARADWIRRPSTLQFLREWPRAGRKRRGFVALWCSIRRGGRSYNCSIYAEEPAGLGFGAAARRLTLMSRIRPVRRDRRDAYDLPVLVTLRFEQPPPAGPALGAAAPPSEAAPAPSP